MNKLLKAYDLFHETEYYQLCLESLIEGQQEQAAERFVAMPLKNQRDMIKWLRQVEDDESFNFFVDLL